MALSALRVARLGFRVKPKAPIAASNAIFSQIRVEKNHRHFSSQEPRDAEYIDLPASTTAQKKSDEFEFDFPEIPELASADVESKAPSTEDTQAVQTGAKVTHTFQTETRQILDIMAKSLYTDKEVFLRELISNASDALEKARYLQSQGEGRRPLEIRIFTHPETNTITIQDFGVGMTDQELVKNLGTIARSGSKEFMQNLAKEGKDGSNIIGQFGVGFYSTFMVADKVEVFSQSAVKEGPAHYWLSDGCGTYELAEAQNVPVGTKIVIHLKQDNKEFAVNSVVEGIIKKYSAFVSFPVFLDDVRVNTVEAIWTLPKESITEDQHADFYKYIANAYDTPSYRLHFTTDAPISINGLFYLPSNHLEKFGMGRLEPGVSLYCRKVLIQARSKHLLPNWMRFIKGVVDSEDIPLNISRENMQDSALIKKIRTVLTRRLIKFMEEQGRKDPERYESWYNEFSQFIKEGVCSDYSNKNEIGALLRFESSLEPYKIFSLDEYVSRMRPDQKGIYFVNAPSRELAETSPYYENFKNQGIEVLFSYNQIDPFVFQNLGEYNKRKLISIEKAEAGDEISGTATEEKVDPENTKKLEKFCGWVEMTLDDRVSFVKVSKRALNVPAIIVDHESGSVRRMLKYMDGGNQFDGAVKLAKQRLEINGKHPIIKRLMDLSATSPDLAKIAVEQVFDNALIAADILDDPRSMLPRLNKILLRALGKGDLSEEPKSDEGLSVSKIKKNE